MPAKKSCRSGSRRCPPLALHALRHASGSAVIAALVGLLASGAGASVPLDAARGQAAGPRSAAAPFAPRDELARLEFVGRAQPGIATLALLHHADTLKVDDPRWLETLLEVGSEYVGLNKGEQVEQVAARIESMSDRVPLARPAAMLLRGQWMQTHGEVIKAERQIIEASALLPANPPGYLRLRVLTSSAYVKNRAGHYDEALARYDEALALVDEMGPTWRRVDLRMLIANLLRDAGRMDKATEVAGEQMRLATESADEYGISAAYTTRAILLRQGDDGDAVLACWRAALDHARVGGNRHQIVIGMANMADYYLRHGQFQTAYDLSATALPLALQDDDPTAQSVALGNKGLALIAMKHKDEGLALVRQSAGIDEHSGTATDVADSQYELGIYLERAGYLDDALGAYHQYRQMRDALNQQDRQRILTDPQEAFANEGRRHELEMLAREGRLKDEEIVHHDLQLKQWMAAGVAGLLLLAVLGVLARRLRTRNQLLSASNEQLRMQAEIDPLTGLSNRHHLQAAMARRPGTALEGTLYLLDVDHFKHVNDRCGHAGGDAVLVEISRRLRHALRDGDLLVRWGGEEFLVLVRPLPPGEAEALAQRLLCALADTPVMHEGRPVAVTASIGFGLFPMRTPAPQPELEVNWERAISLVDAAMYMAKARGRNAACSIRRISAATDAEFEHLVDDIERSERDGRVELNIQSGPAQKGETAPAPRQAEGQHAAARGAQVS